MAHINAGCQRALDLGPPLNQSLLGFSVPVNVHHLGPEIALLINHAGHLVAWGDGTPTVFAPL